MWYKTNLWESLTTGVLAMKAQDSDRTSITHTLRNPGRWWLGKVWWWFSYRINTFKKSGHPTNKWRGWLAIARLHVPE